MANKGITIIKAVFSIHFWKEYIYRKRFGIIRFLNPVIRYQRKCPLSIPIIIISYNRLADLKLLVSFLLKRGHENIVIVDNCSSYPPLLEYYQEIKDRVTIKIMDRNYGHFVFWFNENLYKEYSKGYYIITDSDIVPNEQLPKNYISQMISVLDKYKKITKVGFALKIDDIPDSFAEKQKVLDWEKQFWDNKIENNLYLAGLDTTFALYQPRYRFFYENYYNAIRMAGGFTAKHGGWYIDSKNLTEEDKFYYETANTSNSWKVDSEGNFIGDALYN